MFLRSVFYKHVLILVFVREFSWFILMPGKNGGFYKVPGRDYSFYKYFLQILA